MNFRLWLYIFTFLAFFFPDIERDVSVTLPAESTSYQVTGLHLGHRYRFTVLPTLARGLGAMSFVDERTGTTHPLSGASNICSHAFIPCVIMSTVCVGGRLDVVFLVPASTDRISMAAALRRLLTSAAGSLNTIGARDSQVFVLSACTFRWCAAHVSII